MACFINIPEMTESPINVNKNNTILTVLFLKPEIAHEKMI